MKIIQFECNVCGGMHQPQSDMIFGYSMDRLTSCNQHKIKYTEKAVSDRRHICIDCIEEIKRSDSPQFLP